MKACNKCKIEKPATPEYFYKDKKLKDGLFNTCKECDREYKKQKRAKNKKRIFIYDDKKVKECNKCKIEKPTTPEYFHRDIKMKDGLVNTCKECRKKKSKKYYQENKGKILEYGRNHYQENKEYYAEYYQENKEEISKYTKNHYQENKEENRERNRRYYQENKEKISERGRRYYQENKEKISEYNKNHYQENKEWYREYAITHRLENPEVYRLNRQRRRARMAQLPHTLTLGEWEDALEFFDYSCAYCGVPEDNLEQEHVIPVVKGGGYTADNVIPACRTCNASKNARDLEEWYSEQEFFNIERLLLLNEWIEAGIIEAGSATEEEE